MFKAALLVIAFILLAAIAVRYDFSWSAPFVKATNVVKTHVLEVARAADEAMEKHRNQAETIEKYRAENEKLRENLEVLSAFANEVVSLSKLKEYDPPADFKTRAVRAVAYSELPDLQRITIDYPDLKQGEIKGLIFNEFAAGIVISGAGNYSKALLNGDRECSYSVFVGETKAPGVAMGRGGEMIVRYIPLWMSVNVGDEVITNGLDGIFFAGAKVGVVTKVTRQSAYIEASVEPYYKTFDHGYFYLIEAVK
ncbi:MAG: rod shape-determining protein MreC [Helicobacteraceae bacterium]|jgi:rod shape-determining protein MreC|nr:rod shape-determining protein MreC [Helicobacteraceae bacterium]